MAAPNIRPFGAIVPMIYCYTTPGITYHDGWCKIGYTDKQTVEQRVHQQTHTAGVKATIEWRDNAMYKDGSGEYFHDSDFHAYLTGRRHVEREPKTEWFNVDPLPAHNMFNDFASRQLAEGELERCEYELRAEQVEAVTRTGKYFDAGGTEFLWNAKPRFGKTLTAYDLVMRMGYRNVLIVTNRPSIANSWYDDFVKFFAWRDEYRFVSDNQALDSAAYSQSHREFFNSFYSTSSDRPPMVAFESLQGLKGSKYLGGEYDKLRWVRNTEFDLLIVDESHEGVDTMRTERVFDFISRKHTLYLSGTPFKALADGRFDDEQIFNWSYVDEQEAKAEWDGDTSNPYAELPKLEMYTYQMSAIVEGTLRKGAVISDKDDESVDYAFDLNEFFSCDDKGDLVHGDDVAKFLDALVSQERFPFSTPELRDELKHTFWLFRNVSSVNAVERLLRAHPVFSEYAVINVAGDNKPGADEDGEVTEALGRVRDAISKNDKTITLSAGRLTTGVTVPEWTGVLMLLNLQEPAKYVQAAFRAQNPYTTDVVVDGKLTHVRKETAYVFDFDPARTLIVFESFANCMEARTASGGGTTEERRENICRLLNFFPVLAEDPDGSMVKIDAGQVLSIPRRLKSVEVVRRGFMSNFLFANIGGIFSASSAVADILNKMPKAKEEKNTKRDKTVDDAAEVPVNADGEVEVPQEVVIGRTQDIFGEKVYEVLEESTADVLDDLAVASDVGKLTDAARKVGTTLKRVIENEVVKPAAEDYGVKGRKRDNIVKEINAQVDAEVSKRAFELETEARIAKSDYEARVNAAETAEEVRQAEEDYQNAMADATAAFREAIEEFASKTQKEQPEAVTEKLELLQANATKKTIEDDIRDHLRGFARTIPSFVMAYGDDGLCLANFDDYTEDDVFLEVTGITESEFRFLRDGGDYVDKETGETEHFEGHLFNETVFDDAIAEFLQRRRDLGDYFDVAQDEDIFDYIPPQKTNQIFTPRWVVRKMVDALESENPGCFDDPSATFADLYMKSGLYITEIAKRLFASDALRAEFPDDVERRRHILEQQLYGMAPTRIIYLIATRYIFGFDEDCVVDRSHFVEADAAEASKNGTLAELVDSCFGE